MRIAPLALAGSLVFWLGCSKDGGVIVPATGGGGGGDTTPTTSAGGSGGGDTPTTTSAAEGGGGAGTTTDTGSGGDTTPTSSGDTTTPTPVEDEDKDGWSIEEGDCCDSPESNCADRPELVNPGALESPGNMIDDDCDPTTLDSETFATCSTAAQATADLQNGVPLSALKLAKAMDLCRLTAEDPPPQQKTWGVISAQYTLADGSAADLPKQVQVGVLPDFGPNVKAQFGETLTAISSGTARREGDPGFVHPKSGGPGQTGSFNAQTSCPAPPSYVAANGGVLPSQCSDCSGPDCTTAHDSVALRLRVRPPTNAKGFSYRFNFFSSEYPQFICQEYNDFFVALIAGNVVPEIPPDGNVAVDMTGNPISVNNLLFDVCLPSPGYPCQGGTLELVGNGWGGWNGSIADGGATGWLQNDVPLTTKPHPYDPDGDPVPTADTFDLDIIVWDGGDHNVDSVVLLDRFRWSLEPVMFGVHD